MCVQKRCVVTCRIQWRHGWKDLLLHFARFFGAQAPQCSGSMCCHAFGCIRITLQFETPSLRPQLGSFVTLATDEGQGPLHPKRSGMRIAQVVLHQHRLRCSEWS